MKFTSETGSSLRSYKPSELGIPNWVNVAYDYQIFSLQPSGGISRYFIELFKALIETEEIRPQIWAGLHFNDHLAELRSGVKGIQIPFIPKLTRPLNVFNSLMTRICLAANPPHILHETYFSSASKCKPRNGRVLTVLDMIHEKFPSGFSKGSTVRAAKKKAVERADAIICISECTKSDLLEFYPFLNEKLLHVVHLGQGLSFNIPRPPNKFIGSRPYILYVGARSGYKNFRGLLKAFGSSPLLAQEFSIICFGGPSFSSNELEDARAAGIRLDTLSHVSGGDDLLFRLYTFATAFVYPSFYEGFGLPPLEAMAAGCPVACSNTSSIPEIVGDAAELFNPYDIDSMRFAIERVVYDGSHRTYLIQKGKSKASEYQWSTCARKTAAIYRTLIL